MDEKRKQLRFRPRKPIQGSLNGGGELIQCNLGDLSEGGFQLLVPLGNTASCRSGLAVSGEVQFEGNLFAWSGRVSHVSITQGCVGVGIGLGEAYRNDIAIRNALEQYLTNGEMTAIKLHSNPSGLVMDLIGHFGLSVNRDCLFLIRSGKLRRIDVSQCSDIDSAGLALLQVAAEHGVAVTGEQGRIAELLRLAGLQSKQPPAYRVR